MRNILLILLIGIGGCKESTKEKAKTLLQENKGLAKVRLTDLNNQPINLDQFKGRTIFINFWAT